MISFSSNELLSLARRHRFCAACAILTTLLLVASIAIGIWSRSLTATYHKRQTEGEAVLATLAGGPQVRQELAIAREITRRIENNLVVETDLPENYDYFSRIEEQSKARLDELRPIAAPAQNTGQAFKRIPFSLRISGTYAEVATFLHGVETGPRLASITSFNFRRRSAGSPTIIMEFNLDLLGKN
jgi:Tfp pilus assembly protein PilO